MINLGRAVGCGVGPPCCPASPPPCPSSFRASYSSRQRGAALSASQKIVPAPILSGGHLENASHLSAVLRSNCAFSASVPAMYFGHFRDHGRNAVKNPSFEPLVPFHVAKPMVAQPCQSRGSSSLPLISSPRSTCSRWVFGRTASAAVIFWGALFWGRARPIDFRAGDFRRHC